jgi:uncharacterized membrane protein YdbT with pleckstrin-like domain
MNPKLAPSLPFDPASITRPDPALRTYYILCAACTIVGFPFVIWPLMFKFWTLKYTFDDKGVSMSWGVLFHREIYLTYRRIQDIHVTRNLFHRWLGLAAVAVQTASGSSGAEMTIEGIRNPEALRDFLYQQMRGARGDVDAHAGETASEASAPAAGSDDEALVLLRDIRDEIRGLRQRINHGEHGGHRGDTK